MISNDVLNKRIMNLESKPLIGKKVSVIGGGVSGCATALLLESLGASVYLFEQLPTLFDGASAWSWGRFHLGQHSMDVLDGRDKSGRAEAFVSHLSAKDLFMYPLLKQFLIRDASRPEYYLEKSRFDEYKVGESLTGLEKSFKLLLNKNALDGDDFLQSKGRYYELVPANNHNMKSHSDLVGISSNEFPINMPLLFASLKSRLVESSIDIKLNSKVCSVTKKDKLFTVKIKSKHDQHVLSMDVDYVVNAGWSQGHDLDPSGKPESVGYRSILYVIVNGVQSTKPGTYLSILGSNQINFFHIADDKAVIEVQNLSSPGTTNFHAREASWGDSINHTTLSDDAKMQLFAILNECKKSMPDILGDLTDNNIVDGFYAESWNKTKPGTRASDHISAEAYRSAPDGGYFCLAAEKLPLAFYSALQVSLDICHLAGDLPKLLLDERMDVRDSLIARLNLKPIAPSKIVDLLPLDSGTKMSVLTVYVGSHAHKPTQDTPSNITSKGMFTAYKAESDTQPSEGAGNSFKNGRVMK